MDKYKVSSNLDDLDRFFPSAHRFDASEPTKAEPIAPEKTPYAAARDMLASNQSNYKSGARNAISDLITKPERDQAKEERLKKVAKWSFLGDAIGLIGKGYAASKGAKIAPTEGITTTKALNELQRLDDVYRQEGYRYDQSMLMDAIRQEDNARRDAAAARQRADQANYVQQQRADRDNELKLKREHQLADADAGIQETIRREKVAAQASVKDHENRMALQAQASKARKSSSGGGSGTDDVKPYSANVPMAYTDPKTGKVVNVTDGDFAVLLREAIAWNPELANKLVGLDSDDADKERWQRAARDGVANYLNSGIPQAFGKTVEVLKGNGVAEISIEDFKRATRGVFKGYTDQQLQTMLGQKGINLKIDGNSKMYDKLGISLKIDDNQKNGGK